MALQISYDSTSGFTSANAYVRIGEIRTEHREEDFHIIRVGIFKDEAAYNEGKGPMDVLTFNMPYDDTTPITLGDIYTFLKTQPELSTAIDSM